MSLYKNIARIIGVSAFISLFFLSSTAFAYTIGTVEGDNVNVRSEASLDASVITKYNNGQVLNIIGIEGEFYKIDVDGLNLYISRQFAGIFKGEGTVVSNNVNVRALPSTDSDSLGKLMSGVKVEVLGYVNDWYKVNSNGTEGYIRNDFLEGWSLQYVESLPEPKAQTTVQNLLYEPEPIYDNEDNDVNDKTENSSVPAADADSNGDYYGVVNADGGLRLREGASRDSEVITLLTTGASLEILDIDGEWMLVNYNGKVGHVNSEYIELKYGNAPKGSELAQRMIEYGKQFLGTPYVWAGNDLSTGVDCSGFVYEVFKEFGIGLNRSSSTMVENGIIVEKDALVPGDLVFFGTPEGALVGEISHVGIYMGNGNFIHSSSSTRTWGVTISSLNEEYYIKTYITASRVLN